MQQTLTNAPFTPSYLQPQSKSTIIISRPDTIVSHQFLGIVLVMNSNKLRDIWRIKSTTKMHGLTEFLTEHLDNGRGQFHHHVNTK